MSSDTVPVTQACKRCGGAGEWHVSNDGEVVWITCRSCGGETEPEYRSELAEVNWLNGTFRKPTTPTPSPAMPSREEIAALVERLRELLAGASALPWHYRPDEYDDWGFIRGGDTLEFGKPVVAISRGRGDHDEHRAAKTDPYEPNGRLIVEAINALPTLLAALSSIGSEAE